MKKLLSLIVIMASFSAYAHKTDSVGTKVKNGKTYILHKVQKGSAMRHATFTLTPECILKLTQLSKQQGKAKSALIREWIQQNTQ